MNAALRKIELSTDDSRETPLFLGPTRVVAFDGPTLVVEMPSGESRPAQRALAFPYRPAIGDVVLVITQKGEAEAYVIGLLSAQGTTALDFIGDVDVRAVGGRLRLSGDSGVSIDGPRLDVVVDDYKVVAKSVVQKCATLYQRARELFTLEAKEAHQLVEGNLLSRSKTATMVAEEKVVFNGKQIHLG